MKKLNLFILLVLSACLILPGCKKAEINSKPELNQSGIALKSGSTCEAVLYAAQSIEVGMCEITFIDADEVQITYTINDNAWCLTKTHLDVQIDPANFPQTKKGKPKVMHFAFGQTLDCVSSWSITIDLNNIEGWSLGDELFIAAHAKVMDVSNTTVTAWADGVLFSSIYWATYFSCSQPSFTCGDSFLDDRDGKSYTTVQIGEQCWMAENLNVGTMISGSSNQSDNGEIEKYCYNDSTSNCDTYGGLYQWNEMMQYTTTQGEQGICPAGWHLPTDDEWCILELEVDTNIICHSLHWRGLDGGTKLKQGGSSGFQALLAGGRAPDGSFGEVGSYAYFSTSSKYDPYVWNRHLYVSNATVNRYVNNKHSGISVRCLRDF